MNNQLFANNSNKIVSNLLEVCEDVTIDYLEIGVDALTNSKIIEDIPVVKTVYSLIKLPLTIFNAVYMKKLIYFCYYMKEIPKSKRVEFVNKAVYEDKNFCESLLIMLDRMDHFDKTQLLRNLFRAYGHRDGIDYSTFRRFSYILNQTYVDDLYFLRNHISDEYIGGVNAMALSTSGLTYKSVFDGGGAFDDD